MNFREWYNRDGRTESLLSTAEGYSQGFDAWCDDRGIARDWTGMAPRVGRQAKENWMAWLERREPRDMSPIPRESIVTKVLKRGYAKSRTSVTKVC